MWKIRFKMIHDVKTSIVQNFNILISGVSSGHDSIQINNLKQFLFSILIPPLCLQSSFYLLNLSLTYVLCFCVYYYLYYNSHHYLLFTVKAELHWVSISGIQISSVSLSKLPGAPNCSKTNGLSRCFVNEGTDFWFAPHLLPQVSLKWHSN